MFVPKLSITGIPLDASKFTASDITGASPADATGYGLAAYLPQNNTIWTKSTEIQYLGTDPVDLAFSPVSDATEVTASISYAMKDGVYLITQYWARAVADSVIGTYENGVMTRDGGEIWSGDLGLLTGVYAIGDTTDINSALTLSGLTANTVNISGDPTGLNGPYLFYRVQKYILITNSGTVALQGAIGDMALSGLATGKCSAEVTNSLFDKVLLSSSAKINFNCGNYAKAHNAAILLSELSTSSTSTCKGCV